MSISVKNFGSLRIQYFGSLNIQDFLFFHVSHLQVLFVANYGLSLEGKSDDQYNKITNFPFLFRVLELISMDN